MSESKSPLRREFSEEFKREAVRLAHERGNLCAVAKELGVHESVLGRWKRALKEESPASVAQKTERPLPAFPGKGNPRDEELAKLQREVRRLKEENEILKKAMGIFTSRPT